MSNFQIMPVRGVAQHYGPRVPREDLGARLPLDFVKMARWEFNYDQLPAPGLNNLQQVIPAGSTIVRATFRVIVPFASTSTTTDLLVGLQEADGTEIDNDGLLTAAQLTETTIAVAGALYVGTGALVGFTIGSDDGELIVAPNVNDLTAGRGEVLVEYLTPEA